MDKKQLAEAKRARQLILDWFDWNKVSNAIFDMSGKDMSPALLRQEGARMTKDLIVTAMKGGKLKKSTFLWLKSGKFKATLYGNKPIFMLEYIIEGKDNYED